MRWGSSFSDSFCVSNGVRQGGVLSPVFFLFIWMVYWRNCLILVLVVIGALCLLVLFVMRMILFFWLPVPLLSDLCLKSAVHMQILMV